MVRLIASTISSWLSQAGSIGSSLQETLVYGLILFVLVVRLGPPLLVLGILLTILWVSATCLYLLYLFLASMKIIFGSTVWYVRDMVNSASTFTFSSMATQLFWRPLMIVFEFLVWVVRIALNPGLSKATTQWIRFVRHVQRVRWISW